MKFFLFRRCLVIIFLGSNIATPAQSAPPLPHLKPVAVRVRFSLPLPLVASRHPVPRLPPVVARLALPAPMATGPTWMPITGRLTCALVALAGEQAVAQERARRRIRPDVLLLQVWLGVAPGMR